MQTTISTSESVIRKTNKNGILSVNILSNIVQFFDIRDRQQVSVILQLRLVSKSFN